LKERILILLHLRVKGNGDKRCVKLREYSQYKDLEALYERYKDELVIIGFPANNFGDQRHGTPAQIREILH
jgi:glutathione peroxidase-family protein